MKELALITLDEVAPLKFFNAPEKPGDFDGIKELDKAIEITTGLVYDIENEAGMKKDAQAINKLVTVADKLIAAAYKEVTEVAGCRRSLLKERTKKLADNRLQMIKQFEEENNRRLDEVSDILNNYLVSCWELNDVKHMFRKGEVTTQLVKLSALTPAKGLTKASREEINRMVALDKASQTQYESRLMLIENKCLRNDINPPLTEESFGQAIFASDFEFNDKLESLIEVETQRAAEKEVRIRKQLEAENQRKVEEATRVEQERLIAENRAVLAKKQQELEESNRKELKEAKLQQQAEANKAAIISAEARSEIEKAREGWGGANHVYPEHQVVKPKQFDRFYDDFELPDDNIDLETGEILMPSLDEMLDVLSHHFNIDRAEIKEHLKQLI